MTLCGRPTRAGHPCRLTLTPVGKCPTHDTNLARRNRKVRKAFAANDPAAYAAHQRRAGQRGFNVATQTNYAKAWAMARQRRLDKPSEPERWALDVLAAHGLNHFEREYTIADGRYCLDLAWPEHKLAVEVDGHPADSFPTDRTRRELRWTHKAAALRDGGWTVLVIDATGDRQAEAARLVEFAQKAQA